MTRFERWVRIGVAVVIAAVALQLPTLLVSIPVGLFAGFIAFSGIFGWCPPIFARGSQVGHNLFALPDGREAANIQI